MKKSWLWILTAICALSMAAAGSTKSFAPITAFEMATVFGAFGDGGGGGGTTDPPPEIELGGPKYRMINEDFGKVEYHYLSTNTVVSGTLRGKINIWGKLEANSIVAEGGISFSVEATGCINYWVERDLFKVMQPIKVFSVQLDRQGNEIPGTKAFVRDDFRDTGTTKLGDHRGRSSRC
jgi:hypothetical protein